MNSDSNQDNRSGRSATDSTGSPERSKASRGDTAFFGTSTGFTQPEIRAIPPNVPEEIGRYRILGELGRGGMGAVYVAEDKVLKRKVAIKIPQFDATSVDQMQSRFLREAQMAAQLSHPNICQVYDVGQVDGQLIMAMEYIEGRTLSHVIQSGKAIGERQSVALIKKLAVALEAAHQKGLVHRDLKPANIMIPKPDPSRNSIEPKIMDFGLAKSTNSKSTELTKSGMIVGTPCYMSKEQWSGKDGQLGPQADIYSLGIVFYEILTGKLPYDIDDDEPATAWFVKLVTQPQIPASSRIPNLDPALNSIVMRSIAVEQAQRYSTMAEFANDLNAWTKGELGSVPAFANPRERKPAEEFDFQSLQELDIAAKQSETHRPNSTSVSPPATAALPRTSPPPLLPSKRKTTKTVPARKKLEKPIVIGASAIAVLALLLLGWYFASPAKASVVIDIRAADIQAILHKRVVRSQSDLDPLNVATGETTLTIKHDRHSYETKPFLLKKGKNSRIVVDIKDGHLIATFGTEVLYEEQPNRKDEPPTPSPQPTPAPTTPPTGSNVPPSNKEPPLVPGTTIVDATEPKPNPVSPKKKTPATVPGARKPGIMQQDKPLDEPAEIPEPTPQPTPPTTAPAYTAPRSPALDALIQTAIEQKLRDDVKGARQTLMKASSEFKNNYLPNFYLALTYNPWDHRDINNCDIHFGEALKRSPNHPAILNNRGLLAIRNRKHAKGMDSIRRAIKLGQSPEAEHNWSRLRFNIESMDASPEDKKKILVGEANPDSYQTGKGWLYMAPDSSPESLRESLIFAGRDSLEDPD